MWRYDDVAIFVTVVEQGSFVDASRHLNIPTSTVSRRISDLETALGIKLIERTSRKLTVTEKGKFLYQQCLTHVKDIYHGVTDLEKNRDLLAGKIRITAPVFLGNAVIGPWFCDFLNENDQIELDIILSNQYEDIIEEGIDIAIRIGPLKDSQFIAQYLFSAKYSLVASPAYISRTPAIERPDDLLHHDVMSVIHHNKQLKLTSKETRQEYAVNISTRLASDDIELSRLAAINGVGVACLPAICVSRLVETGQLVSVLNNYGVTPVRDIYAVYPSKQHLSVTTRRLIDYLKKRGDQYK